MKPSIGMAIAGVCLVLGGNAAARSTYIELNGYCDYFSGVSVNGVTSIAVHDLTAHCTGALNNAVSVGARVTIPHKGSYILFGDNYRDALGGTYTGKTSYYGIQLPLKTGNGWFLYETSDGTAITYSNSGTYTLTRKPPAVASAKASFQVKNLFTPER